MVEAANLARFLICYILCAVYSGWVAFGLLIAYIFKRNSPMWECKERPDKPLALTSNEFGEHKFMTVNVSGCMTSSESFRNFFASQLRRVYRFITLRKATRRIR